MGRTTPWSWSAATAPLRPCNESGADAIRVHGTLAPGVPVGTILGGAAHGMRVVTKSGGFGRSDSLLEIVDRLQSSPSIRKEQP